METKKVNEFITAFISLYVPENKAKFRIVEATKSYIVELDIDKEFIGCIIGYKGSVVNALRDILFAFGKMNGVKFYVQILNDHLEEEEREIRRTRTKLPIVAAVID